MAESKRWSEDYVAHVLRPNFSQARQYLFVPLMLVSKAHALMLYRAKLLAKPQAQAILASLEHLQLAGAEAFRYSEEVEDLYFAVERQLIAATGPNVGGNLQIARSRNDVDSAMIRLVLRETILGAIEALAELRETMIDLAVSHVDSLMPGYTHSQPAQPTTLAHYLAGNLAALERDAQRLQATFANVNQNPLGAAALTTTPYAIDRHYTEQLLGFEGLAENGFEAVGGVDHVTAALGALITLEINLSRLNHDLLLFSNREFGFFGVADAFIQISSIMPQKRNPVVLEHVRAKLSRAHGAAQTVFTLTRNVPFGDVNDVGENLIHPTLEAFTSLDEALDLLEAVLRAGTWQITRMEARAGEHFTTATGLADALVLHGLAFRSAHGVVSGLVDLAYQRELGWQDITAALVDEVALVKLGYAVGLDDTAVAEALNPRAFVDKRANPGGPNHAVMLGFLEIRHQQLVNDELWRRDQLAKLRHAREELQWQVTDLIEG
jgi:argininosuccinate lyase